MRLFDEGRRTYTDLAKNNESAFTFLNKSAKAEFTQARVILESWFANYPDSEKGELQKAFRSHVNTQHYGAFFELVVFETLLKLGYKVTVHPELSGTTRRPDFLAEASPVDRFYMEATLVAEKGAKEDAADARKNVVYDLLNSIHSPNFYLSLESNGAPASTPSAKQFASVVEFELAKLNPDATRELIDTQGLDSLPSWLFEHDGWRLTIRPVPKGENVRSKPNVRTIALISDGFQLANSHARIRNAILDKTSHYGQFGLPFIIAIDVQEVVEETDIMEALFGQERLTVTFGEGQEQITTEMGRDLHGGWTLPHGPRGTRISGILVAQRLRPWSIRSAAIRLYHNPWSTKPLPSSSALCRVPQSVNSDRTMRPIPGTSLGTILRLDTDAP